MDLFKAFDSFQNLLHAQSHTISEYVRWFYQTNNNANKIDKKKYTPEHRHKHTIIAL